MPCDEVWLAVGASKWRCNCSCMTSGPAVFAASRPIHRFDFSTNAFANLSYLDQIGQTRTVANLKRRLERLGYRVILELLEPNDQPT